MFQFLQVKAQPAKLAPHPDTVSLRQLLGDASLPMSIQTLIGLPGESSRRLSRALIPPSLLTLSSINPFTCRDRRGQPCVHLVEKTSPGGVLHRALDGSSPFRQPEQWSSVRGRASSIHDGVLDGIEARWNDLHRVKQVGRRAGVETFPGATD